MSHWDDLAQLLLDAVADLEGFREFLDERDLARHLSLDEDTVRREAQRLYRGTPPYIDGIENSSSSEFHIVGVHLTERGLRQTGVWPSQNVFNEFLSILDERIESETDPAKRTKLSAIRDAAADVGKGGALGGVLATLIKHATGI